MVRTLEVGVEGRMGPEMLTKVASRTNEDLCKTMLCGVGGMAAKVDVWTFGLAAPLAGSLGGSLGGSLAGSLAGSLTD